LKKVEKIHTRPPRGKKDVVSNLGKRRNRGEKMETQKRKKYTKEFKTEAVNLLLTQGYSAAEAARRLGIDPGILGRWKRQLEEKDQDAFPGNGRQSGLEEENRKLRAELRRAQMERDILKKATAFFARESL
jgi:transposase